MAAGKSQISITFDIAAALYMADSRLARSQWETSLQSNAVSHWLGAKLDLLHKSQNAHDPYPTMLHSEQKYAHLCSE